jgi:asparagine synthase (glutamine-hydrolysing)
LGAKYLLNEQIRASGRKVALSGEGSDEIFMGYSHLKQDYLSMHALTGMEKQYLAGFQLPQGETLDLSSIRQKLGWVPTWIQAKSSMAHKMQAFWTPEFNSAVKPYEQIALELQGYQSPLKASSASWAQYCLSGYILKVLDDAQAMAHGIEGRLPFLDTDVLSFAYGLPDELYFHENREKGLLREGFKHMLPKDVIQKTKQSFMSPPVNRFMMEKEVKEMVEQYLFQNKKLKDTGWFNLDRMQLTFAGQAGVKPEYEPILMTFLTLGIFVETFL